MRFWTIEGFFVAKYVILRALRTSQILEDMKDSEIMPNWANLRLFTYSKTEEAAL